MINAKHKRIIFCFGEGGHAAEAFSLYSALRPYLSGVEIMTVGDFHEKPTWSDWHVYYPPLRDKALGFTAAGFLKAAKAIWAIFGLISNPSTRGIVSTGPGFCVVICAIGRLFCKHTIHIETYCRINSQSLTGKIIYYVCNRFYVQNKEQLNFYKNAQYCGLL